MLCANEPFFHAGPLPVAKKELLVVPVDSPVTASFERHIPLCCAKIHWKSSNKAALCMSGIPLNNSSIQQAIVAAPYLHVRPQQLPFSTYLELPKI